MDTQHLSRIPAAPPSPVPGQRTLDALEAALRASGIPTVPVPGSALPVPHVLEDARLRFTGDGHYLARLTLNGDALQVPFSVIDEAGLYHVPQAKAIQALRRRMLATLRAQSVHVLGVRFVDTSVMVWEGREVTFEVTLKTPDTGIHLDLLRAAGEDDFQHTVTLDSLHRLTYVYAGGHFLGAALVRAGHAPWERDHLDIYPARKSYAKKLRGALNVAEA